MSDTGFIPNRDAGPGAFPTLPASTEDALIGADQGQDPPATGEGESSEGPSFFDGDVSPELEPERKRMQAAFTKKTQALAQEKREFAGEVHKASLFDQLMANPAVVDFLNQLQSGQPSSQRSGRQQQEANFFDEESTGTAIPEVISQEISSLRDEVKGLKMQEELRKFGQAYPNWEQEKEGMLESWKANPYLSIEDAYLRSVGRKALAAQQNRARQQQEQSRRESLSTEQPTAPRSQKAIQPATTWDEAVKQALDMHKMSSKDFFGG